MHLASDNAIPLILEMKPKEMRREWAIFTADHLTWQVGNPEFDEAEIVRLSIDMLILNLDRGAEQFARRVLEQNFATFSASWRKRRG